MAAKKVSAPARNISANKPAKATKLEAKTPTASKSKRVESALKASTLEGPAKKATTTRAAKPTTAAGVAASVKPKASDGPHDAAVRELRAFGLRYPEAHIKSPWPGHLDLAVRDKTFAYLSLDGDPLSIGCKLPQSCQTALSLPFAAPTPYGLGKSGWVTANFDPADEPPVEFLKAWIDESYRAIAPKTLVKKLPAAE